jgi:hypothetical protein
MQDVFNPDRYKQRQTAEDQAEIERLKGEFLKNGGKIEIIASSVSSGVNDLSEKQRSELRKKALKPGRGGAKK